MADALDVRVGHCEEGCEELKARVEEEHARLDTHSDAIERFTHWALEGNGDSAEVRLAMVEKKVEVLPEMQAALHAVGLVADAKLSDIKTEVSGAVKTQMDARDRTAIAYIKAFAPYVAAAAAAAIAVFK